MIGLASLLLFFTAHAQKSVDAADAGAEKATQMAVTMMKRGQWKEAHSLFQQIIAEWGNDAYYSKMPAFGTVYYNRGFCEMKLKDYGAAVDSFKKCYEDFLIKDKELYGLKH